ncbi:MAG: hypothetical protein R2774_04190 [Saprospiraceae bacterium]
MRNRIFSLSVILIIFLWMPMLQAKDSSFKFDILDSISDNATNQQYAIHTDTLKTPANSKSQWHENPITSFNLFSGSAFNLKKGDMVVRNLQSFYYGVSNKFSVSGGVNLFSLFNSVLIIGEIKPIFTFTAKYTTPINNNARFGLSSVYIGTLSKGESIYGMSGMATLGDFDKNVTIGLVFGSSSDENLEVPMIINIAGQIRTSKKIMFISDNFYFFKDAKALLMSLGVNYIGSKIIGGFAFGSFISDDNEMIVFPIFHFSFKI